jgi:alkylresorcinol/alkylpyrone synthase
MTPTTSIHPQVSARAEAEGQARELAPGRRATASIAGLGSAFPSSISQAEAWETFFEAHYGGSKRARAIWRHCGVERRHHAVDPRVEADLPSWGTEKRMRRFQSEAPRLALEAVDMALRSAAVDPAAIHHVTVVSSTGYSMPSIDLRLLNELGFSRGAQRVHLGHMGCGGAIPGLTVASNATAVSGHPGVLVCVELPSLHIQPASRDAEQALTHAIFSDAAAAAVLVPDAGGLEVVDATAVTDDASEDLATLEITDHGFRIGLSAQVPRVIERHVAAAVHGLLERNALAASDVGGWAVHPGGPAILDAVADTLALPREELAGSRDVLRQHGNCSAATILIVLDMLRRTRRLRPGGHVVLVAFSPGITVHAVLLRERA